MTEQELSKIPFRCVCHIALKDEHIATYSDESGRLGFSVTTPKKDEFTYGKGRTHYRIDNKIYKSKKKFLEALKEFSFKVVPIRYGDMTDKEKLQQIKGLADGMYYAAKNMTTDASKLRKAMERYHQFIIKHYYEE